MSKIEPLTITLKTLTPLWTGGVDGTCDRLHETGLIGSLRWWYEALVRGLGGYACDPTSDAPNARCQFDSKAYEAAKREGKTEEEAIQAGLHTVCAVCYLFGCTGWARLFQLQAIEVPATFLHFRTTLRMNQDWLKCVFGGESQNIDSLKVPYGNIRLQFIPRRQDADYAKSQFALILRVAANYGGIGARVQHGFGQFVFPNELEGVSLSEGITQLRQKIEAGFLRSEGPAIDTPFNMQNFVSLIYQVPKDKDALSVFMRDSIHVGSPSKKQESAYIPCIFDLRYKGKGKLGLRKWLKGKGWKETTDPKKWEELDLLLGPRSQWVKDGAQRQVDDDYRMAGRVFFGMPYRKEGDDLYVIRVWAFWIPELQKHLSTPEALVELLDEYMQQVFPNVQPTITLGKAILEGGKK